MVIALKTGFKKSEKHKALLSTLYIYLRNLVCIKYERVFVEWFLSSPQ